VVKMRDRRTEGLKMPNREHREHLWNHEVEDDKRVKEAQRRLHEKNPTKSFYVLLEELMEIKGIVLFGLLEKKRVHEEG